MLHIIRNNNPFTVLILFIFVLVSHFQELLHPVAPLPVAGYPAYNFILQACGRALHASAFGFTMLAVILLFLQALFLNALAKKHRLFPKSTYVPAFCYILTTALHKDFGYFSSFLFVNWLLLGALNVMLEFMQPVNPRKHIFNAGFLVGMSTLFEFSAVLYFLLLLLALLLMRSFSLGEWFVGLLGFLTVFYFLAGILFLTDDLPELKNWVWSGVTVSKKFSGPLYTAGLLSGLAVLVVCGLFVIQAQIPKSPIYIRRSIGVIISMLIISVPAGLFSMQSSSAVWLMVMPALALIISQPLYLEKSRMFSNFIFYFSLLLLVFCQSAI